jgi:hypothetical protein
MKNIYLMQEYGKDCRINGIRINVKKGNFHETVTDCG